MNLLSLRPARLLRCLTAVLALAWGGVPARADELMRQVQEELRRRNLYFGDVNGLKSPRVAAALRRYQQRKGFRPTGEVDGVTLQSLSLSPAVTAAASEPASPAPTAGPIPAAGMTGATDLATPWPDVPVLRSDLGRASTEPLAGIEPVDPTPAPSAKPPPAAFQRGGSDEGNLRGFVEDFLKRSESNDPKAQLDCFADRVDYFDDGKVNKAFIVKETKRYNERWPIRHFALVEPLQAAGVSNPFLGMVVVSFRCRFDVRQSGHGAKGSEEVKGEIENTCTLVRTGPDSLRIVAIRERRVRR